MNLIADIKYINGKIYTLKSDGDCKEAFCVEDGKILAVGSNDELSGIEAAKVVNLEGKTVLPGFIDCHQHALEYARTKIEVDLRGTSSKEELLSRLKKRVEEVGDGVWIKGSGFDHEKFPDKQFPTAADLDNVSTKNPIVISRYCVHFHVANTLAMRMAGITDCDSGLLRESAVTPVMNLIPDMFPTLEDKKSAMKKAIAEMNKCGITGIHVTEAPISKVYEDFKVYQHLERENELNARVYFCPAEFPAYGMETGFGNDMLRYGFHKMFVDGSLGPRTAALSEPYTDMPDSMGVMTNSLEQVKSEMKEAYDRGLQIGIHAIGDRGIETAVEAMEECYRANPRKDARFRLIHGMCMRPDLIARIKQLPIIIDIQPSFTSNSNIWWSEDRLGPERIKYAYAWRTLIDEGIILTGSSDTPVEDFAPLLGIYSVVCRQDRTGKPEGGWMPHQRVSVYEAACMYTKNAAYASYEENIKGTIEQGKLADYVILEEDIFNINPMRIKDVCVVETCLGGKTVYHR